MKGFLLMFMVFLTTVGFSNAQAIESKGVLGGYKFTQDGEELNYKDLAKIMRNDGSAYRMVKKARSRNRSANVLGFIGGGLIGWPVGAYLADGEPNWTLAAVGIGVVFFSVSLSTSASKKAKRAVDLYNSSLDETSFHTRKPQFDFIAGGNQIGFVMTF